MASENAINAAKRLIEFINKSPSPFHAVQTMRKRLIDSGFKELVESEHWQLKPNDRVFFTRNHSTLFVVSIGGKYEPGNGFSIIGAHTDSPCPRIKPKSLKTSCGYCQLGVQTYGGGLWYTWFDRDLKVAGKVISRDPNDEFHLRSHLVHVDRPICRISSLAIHLNRDISTNGFKPNLESHLPPILGTCVYNQLCADQKDGADANDSPASTSEKSKTKAKHPAVLLKLLAQNLNINENEIVDLDLCLADHQPATIGGINEEFIFAPRLDNLFNSFASMEAIIDSSSSLVSERNIRIACMYDNEEVGSESAPGAASALTEHLLRRLQACVATTSGGNGDLFERAVARSLIVSADQAHAVHPNYSDKHEANHRPELHKGIVLKVNANQRYASNAFTQAVLREVARQANVPLQEFVVNQDMACGSTIGPILSTKLGIATVDVGGPMLAMHSCREMCDVTSVHQSIQLFTKFYECFSSFKFGEDFN